MTLLSTLASKSSFVDMGVLLGMNDLIPICEIEINTPSIPIPMPTTADEDLQCLLSILDHIWGYVDTFMG